MIARLLFVINREAATGCGDEQARRVAAVLAQACGPEVAFTSRLAAGHAEVTRSAGEFLEESAAPALIVAGGGGGTLRAVIEAVCARSQDGNLLREDRVRLAAMRMGSGNVLAKALGMPRAPEDAARALGAAVRSGRTVPVSIVRCEFSPPDGEPQARFAATLGGFGQLGRVPGDLARWRRRLPGVHRLAAAAAGIERITPLEYALALALRALWCAVRPGSAETIDVRTPDGAVHLRLLAGALLTFRMPGLPIDPGVGLGDAAFSLHLVPLRGRRSALGLALRPGRSSRSALAFRICGSQALEIALADRRDAAFFLDEDPLAFSGRIRLSVAGVLAFVPGPGAAARTAR